MKKARSSKPVNSITTTAHKSKPPIENTGKSQLTHQPAHIEDPLQPGQAKADDQLRDDIGKKYGVCLAEKHQVEKRIADLNVELMLIRDNLRILAKRWTDSQQPNLPGCEEHR
jgi:hypothetical protein